MNHKSKLPLSGRTALVTGSSRNLGAAIATELASRGARVAVTYREHRAEAEQVLENLPRVEGGEHLLVHADLTSMEGAGALATEVLQRAINVDILINNAGPFNMEPFLKLDLVRFDEMWMANVGAVVALVRTIAPAMQIAGKGRIINISAGSAYVRNHGVYTLAKSALITLTEQLALELGPEITVNAVAPGQIAESADEMSAIDPTFVENCLAATPLGELVTRPQVAALVASMCGSEFDQVTGVTIPIDGGCRLGRLGSV
ncbi:MAG TPA: SDR family oxidoreductase [Candidatus Nanopelagicaceae bacterium]|nr:SDR family oxidoreductase [Candidatus Nanopelagicaceae bacterium]